MSGILIDPSKVEHPYAVNVAVAAKMLSLTDWQVRKLIRDRKLRARNTGKSYIIPMSAIHEYLAGSDEPMAHPDSA